MTLNQLNALITRASKLDDKQLKETYDKARRAVLSGKGFDGLDSDQCLMFVDSLKRMIADRFQRTTSETQSSRSDIVKQLVRDVPGLTEEQALKYVSEHGNPYVPESQRQHSAWDGIERRGIRKPGFTAQDLD